MRRSNSTGKVNKDAGARRTTVTTVTSAEGGIQRFLKPENKPVRKPTPVRKSPPEVALPTAKAVNARTPSVPEDTISEHVRAEDPPRSKQPNEDLSPPFHSPTKSARKLTRKSAVAHDSPDAKLPPLSQPSPINGRRMEDMVYWMASPPTERLKSSDTGTEAGHAKNPEAEISGIVRALKRHESDEKVVVETSHPVNWTLPSDSLPNHQLNPPYQPLTSPSNTSLKRSHSLSTVEQSPSSRTSNRKRMRVATSHWTLASFDELKSMKGQLDAFATNGQGACDSVFESPSKNKGGSGAVRDLLPLEDVQRVAAQGSNKEFGRCMSMPTLSGTASDPHSPGTDPMERTSLRPIAAQKRSGSPLKRAAVVAVEDLPMHRKQMTSEQPTAVTKPSTTNSNPFVETGDEFDDPFGDDDDLVYSIALDAVEKSLEVASQVAKPEMGLKERTDSAISQVESPRSRRATYQRFLVLEIDMIYQNPEYRMNPEKILRLFDEAETSEKYLHLREDWYETDVNVGDYVHVIGTFTPDNHCTITNAQNLLILHPDVLISATYAADSFDCLRRSILQDRVKATNEMTAPMVYGNMLHEMLQTGLREGAFESGVMAGVVEALVMRHLESLWAIGEGEGVARTRLQENVPIFREWGRKFLARAPRADGVVQVHRSNNTAPKTTACIERVLDIEEHIWSPMYGIKGNIDASVLMSVRSGHGTSKRLLTPFEVKTGKNSTVQSHRAQTSLYTLLMGDRYEIDVSSGMLYYVQTGEMIQIPSLRDEIRGILINRNRMAVYLNSQSKLPPVLQNAHKCQRCYVLDTCMVYHKGLESGTADTSGLGSLFDMKTSGMTRQHVAFFEKWERLITLEEGDMQRFKKEIWVMGAAERQKIGRCFSRMRVLPTDPNTKAVPASGERWFRYRFVPADITSTQMDASSMSLLSSHMSVGDPIVISSEEGHLALAIGFIVDLQPTSVTVNVDREVRGVPKRLDPFDEEVNQNFWGLDWAGGGVKGKVAVPEDRTVYRIDKDELTTGMALVRGNLVSLFAGDGDEKRRRLVVDLETPVFAREESCQAAVGKGLNSDQRIAVAKVLAAKDYALILGMPGTGKTTTIAFIIKTLVKTGKSVLLTSYTHSAVDNVLLKLKEERVDFVRLGSVQKVHSAIQEYTPNYKRDIRTIAGYEELYSSKQVVATTCLGINHMLFSKRTFDYCIVDEASQLTLPVRNPEAKDSGLAHSLFKHLSEAHPQAVVSLEHQYRMNADIMQLSNGLIYNQRLKCGTEEVASGRLEVARLGQGLGMLHGDATHSQRPAGCGKGMCWMEGIVDPTRSVIFADTDGILALESRFGDLVQNDVEAELVYQVVSTLILCGINESSIGIISPYRSQLKIIGSKLKRYPGLEIHTVDRYQGRDKDCIVVSLVRSNRGQNIGDLLRDWRRINVAFTRARTKLIIFGSRTTLEGTTLFKEFLKIIDRNSWCLPLPPQAHTIHSIPISNTSPGRIQATNVGKPLPKKAVKEPKGTSENAKAGVNGKGTVLQQQQQAAARLKALVKGKHVVKNVLDEIFFD